MINILGVLFWLLGTHYLADFLLQSDKMAINKSTSLKWLSIHVGVYTLTWIIVSCGWLFSYPYMIGFILFNGLCHWIIDFFTSRAASYYWKKEKRHEFICIIGLDQALHTFILLGTFLFWS